MSLQTHLRKEARGTRRAEHTATPRAAGTADERSRAANSPVVLHEVGWRPWSRALEEAEGLVAEVRIVKAWPDAILAQAFYAVPAFKTLL